MNEIVVSFPDGTEATVAVEHIPRQGEFFVIAAEGFEVGRVVYDVLDFQKDKPDYIHKSRIKIILCHPKEGLKKSV
jgi:hypothetical protein